MSAARWWFAGSVLAALVFVAGRLSVGEAPVRTVAVEVPVAGPVLAEPAKGGEEVTRSARPTVISAGAPISALPVASPSVPAHILERASRDVVMALDAQRADLRSRCWNGLPGQAAGAPLNLKVQLGFDAEGREIARGIIEDRENQNPEMLRCLQEKAEPLRIPGPGVNLSLEATLRLP